jgi:hypothetical protein
MNTKTTRLVYSASPHDHTVTIDYDASLKLFLTGEERIPFSAEKLIRMLNYRAQAQRVQSTVVGRLLVVVGEARCELTGRAVGILAHLYHLRQDWQVDYPELASVFAALATKEIAT